MQPTLTLRAAALFYLALLAVAVGWSLLTTPGLRILTQVPQSQVIPWPLAGLLAALALIALTRLAEIKLPSARNLGRELAAIVAPVTWPRVLVLALSSGIAEEALFRGPMQHALGFFATTLLFGLCHGGLRRTQWLWTLFALIAGLIFGGLTLLYRSPWPAMLSHVVVNAVNLRRLGALGDAAP